MKMRYILGLIMLISSVIWGINAFRFGFDTASFGVMCASLVAAEALLDERNDE